MHSLCKKINAKKGMKDVPCFPRNKKTVQVSKDRGGGSCHQDVVVISRVSSPLSPRRGSLLVGFSHDNAVFVVAWSFLYLATVSGSRNLHGSAFAADSRLDDGQSLLSSAFASVSCLDIPDVGLENVTTTANAHFGKVSHGVLCFHEAWRQLVIDQATKYSSRVTYRVLQIDEPIRRPLPGPFPGLGELPPCTKHKVPSWQQRDLARQLPCKSAH